MMLPMHENSGDLQVGRGRQRPRCLQQRDIVLEGCALCKTRTVQASDSILGNNLVVRSRLRCRPIAMAQNASLANTMQEGEWKEKLKIPERDQRVQTAVRALNRRLEQRHFRCE